MTYRLLSGSCSNGPCPTFHVDDRTRDVLVQGYRIDSPIPLPDGEDVVHIPADAWGRLMRDLPLSMLLSALATRWRRPRPSRTPVASTARSR